MTKKAKYKELLQKRDAVQKKLDWKRKGYRGVIHESALSELRHSEYKVLEAHLISIEKELEELEHELERKGP